MSQTENHWDEVVQIETELVRHLIALGIDWRDEAAMSQLAAECKIFDRSTPLLPMLKMTTSKLPKPNFLAWSPS